VVVSFENEVLNLYMVIWFYTWRLKRPMVVDEL